MLLSSTKKRGLIILCKFAGIFVSYNGDVEFYYNKGINFVCLFAIPYHVIAT
jgi:hypothetical protein